MKLKLAFFTVISVMALCACSNVHGTSGTAAPESTEKTSPPRETSGGVIIEFNYVKQSGWASNQFAVWVEDADGNLIKTLYATRYTAKGGYADRPDSIPDWVKKSGIDTMDAPEVDAVSGATPKTGGLSYTWDLTDDSGNAVGAGEYAFFVEGSLRWKNRVVYSGVIKTDGEEVTVEAKAEYFYEASEEYGGQEALNGNSDENGMITAVKASYVSNLF
ncbi:MAG: DUF2271 domain-containing protein [Oscillospiraceae bacterium]|jgi:hypothetical protein|nr:DUF2271 domain-containing protein [Oscillospiraceae bacterium]